MRFVRMLWKLLGRDGVTQPLPPGDYDFKVERVMHIPDDNPHTIIIGLREVDPDEEAAPKAGRA